MPQIIVIADDLTGAADTGAMFASEGLQTLVTFQLGFPVDAEALVVSTHSRHLSTAEATATNQTINQQLHDQHPDTRWLYKKVDSTLRGHPGAELATLMQVWGIKRALIAPAFPDQGRTTVEGHQQVHGEILEKTPFREAVTTSDLSRLFRVKLANFPVYPLPLTQIRQGVAVIQHRLMTASSGLFIADAETATDLACLVTAAVSANLRLLCGSAGLAQAMQAVISFQPTQSLQSKNQSVISGTLASPNGPILIVAGSRHPQTTAQISALGQDGVGVIKPLLTLDTTTKEALKLALAPATAALKRSEDIVLTTVDLDYAPGAEQAIAKFLGEMVKYLLDHITLGGLILTGGDIALAVCTALESNSLWVQGEVESGIPWGVLANGAHRGLPVVTKAGGFGTKQSLSNALTYLKNHIILSDG